MENYKLIAFLLFCLIIGSYLVLTSIWNKNVNPYQGGKFFLYAFSIILTGLIHVFSWIGLLLICILFNS